MGLHCETKEAGSRERSLVCGLAAVGLGKLLETLRAHALGALDGEAESAVPGERGEDTKSTRDAKENGVVVHLLEAVVLEEDARVGIDIGPWVLGLALLEEDWRNNLVEASNELDKLVALHVLEGKLALAHVAGVGDAKNSVAIAGDDLAAVERIPDVLLDLVIGGVGANLLGHLGDPDKDLLVGKAVKRASQTAHASGERKVGIGERRANKVGGVSADVAALVIRMDGEVKAHELSELLVVKAEHGAEVGRPILLGVDGGDVAIVEGVAVDESGNAGELGNEVDRVLVHVLPVLLLVDAARVGLGKLALRLHGGNGGRKLAHGVQARGEVGDQVNDVLRQVGAGSPLAGNGADLVLGGDLAREKEPKGSLGEGLGATRGGRELLLELGEGEAAVADARVGVEDGSLGDKALDRAHATVGHVDGDLANDGVVVLLAEGSNLGRLLRDELGKTVLEATCRRGAVGAHGGHARSQRGAGQRAEERSHRG
eukprot:m.285352 g.285352  ORF g.285352 m.285352 type:complete len:487 (+) comp11360_c0_seq1:18-1478(+)